ncbi:hypothetical protein SNOG_13677 [Parastagonospora nodorum SN15]|uniref:Uncharacterized protein n=1 Tax=Phaeosphaeria nodorum (strain SN15 / ATCC MYA-4574 / FGSC 10173) TaxID=321614 RepID=Q0U3I7_PHANO|nr:hypothetical protein SNOG_13677 [Parastagonospora nodorum SN15]EAT79124.1 hypothetical protein SNOG_13677 [Parastagonospora nodorum SN15]
MHVYQNQTAPTPSMAMVEVAHQLYQLNRGLDPKYFDTAALDLSQ